MADLEGEDKRLSVAELRYIHERKTSALLCCSVRLGGMSANCTSAQLAALTDFGYHVGLAFQVIDDILDVTQTTEQLGKTAGKDARRAKSHLPGHRGPGKIAKGRRATHGQGIRRAEGFQGQGGGAGSAGGVFVEAGKIVLTAIARDSRLIS